ncbi:hypothetical protein SORBI_3002G118101 [Sorghum bicolor]|uniref:Uncharacterized protein n=1 Tax=Sorghum bicolor TaxID=4558 RepID=A0A1W0W3D0_SORBI|nr:hypothetical protein SORBI_3002G118101 [Sorghum bicolor]
MLMVPYMREYVPWYHDWIQTRRCWRPPCRSPFHKSFESTHKEHRQVDADIHAGLIAHSYHIIAVELIGVRSWWCYIAG